MKSYSAVYFSVDIRNNQDPSHMLTGMYHIIFPSEILCMALEIKGGWSLTYAISKYELYFITKFYQD